MPTYRIYVLEKDDHIRRPPTKIQMTDQLIALDIISKARRMAASIQRPDAHGLRVPAVVSLTSASSTFGGGRSFIPPPSS
jgi:hypothetical protein